MIRRDFLRWAASTACCGASARRGAAQDTRPYPYLGRTDDYAEFRIIERGLTIEKVESWANQQYGFVRVTTRDGRQGTGQLSPSEAQTTARVLHRQVARHVLGADPADIDAINDRVIDANMKYPWSFVCRALAGVDTAIWDLYGQIRGRPVCALLGGKAEPFPAYGSSMRRDISPEDEAARLARLRDSHGYRAFKVRAGVATGHDRDAAPGRTEKLIPTVRKAVGDDIRLMADGNSCYTPPKALEVGRLMQDHRYYFFEEPCPYWELEWTAQVAARLDMFVAGGEQDNDMAQWRRMIGMNAVDIVQPDLCYVGGFTRALRVARMAARAGKAVVPHSSHHSLVTVFALHLMACIPNAGPFIEFSIEQPGANENEALYRPRLVARDGRVNIPDGPGWGVTVNPDWLSKATYQKSERSRE